MPFFGIDISPFAIKVTRLKKTAFGMIPTVVARLDVSETCSLIAGGNGPAECADVKRGLSMLRKKHKMEFARVSVPDEYAHVFRMAVPREAVRAIGRYVLYNMEQYAPLKPQEVVFDYRLLGSQSDSAQVEIVVTAISAAVVERYTALLESAGITAVAFEPQSQAVARSVILEGDDSPYVIINVDDRSTSVSVAEGGSVQYVQTLPVRSWDVEGDMDADVSAALRDGINKVIIHWFTSRDQDERGARIENIILTGDAVDSANIINFLESTLSVNAAMGNVWKNCFDLNDYVPRVSRRDSLRYAACVGLCLDTLK